MIHFCTIKGDKNNQLKRGLVAEVVRGIHPYTEVQCMIRPSPNVACVKTNQLR